MLDRLATSYVALDGSGGSGVYASLDQASARPRKPVTVEKKQKSGGFKPKTTKKGLSYHESGMSRSRTRSPRPRREWQKPEALGMP